MKKFLTVLFCISALGVAAFAQKTKAKPVKKEMTAREYFLAIPTEYLKAPAAKRAAWIESDNSSIGNVSFNIPATELVPGATEADGKVFGDIQVFKRPKGGALIGIANNLCAEGECIGLIRFLDYNNGKWTDATEDHAPMIDNDEVINILRNAPAWTKTLKDGVQVPLAIQFNGNMKSIYYIAGCVTSCDGGVVAVQFKWNGQVFAQYEDEVSPD